MTPSLTEAVERLEAECLACERGADRAGDRRSTWIAEITCADLRLVLSALQEPAGVGERIAAGLQDVLDGNIARVTHVRLPRPSPLNRDAVARIICQRCTASKIIEPNEGDYEAADAIIALAQGEGG